MSLIINHNMMASNVARNLNSHYGRLSTSTQRLSSGLRINSAADDAAGMAIRELMRSDITTLQQGARNANDAISLIQTAGGALSIIDEKLIRMKELAEQAATGTYDSTQRMLIESEYQAMASEITRISNATDFNGIKLLNGNLSGEHNGSDVASTGSMKIHFRTGNNSDEDYYYIEIGNMTASALGIGNNAIITTSITYAEKIAEALASAYNKTYAEAYNKEYSKIYNALIAGGINVDGLDNDAAHAQADGYAKAKAAAEEATADKNVLNDYINESYNAAYGDTYSTAYATYIANGETADSAKTKAEEDAKVAAEDKALNNLTGTLGPDMPPNTKATADSYINAAVSAAKDELSKQIYNNLYTQAVAAAVTNTAIFPATSTSLNAQQAQDIHDAVSPQATSLAKEFVEKHIEPALKAAYQAGYTVTSGAMSVDY